MLLNRAIHTRFRYASPAERVRLATHGNSPVHYAKGTPSHIAPPKRSHSAPPACRYMVSGTISLSSRLCFSPFPHGTCSLSVAKEYLALGGGPPEFRPGFTCPAVLGKSAQEDFFTHTGLSPSLGWLSSHFRFIRLYQTCAPPQQSWRLPRPRSCSACGLPTHNRFRLVSPKGDTLPRSLTATEGVEVSFLSCGY